MNIKVGLVLGLLGLVVSCVEPVIRRSEESPAVAQVPYEKADLKKRLWIVPLTTSIAWNPKKGPDPEIGPNLEKKLAEVLGKAEGPFTVTRPYGVGVDDSGVTAETENEELKQVAQAAGADGYLKVNVVEVDVLRTQLPEGLVKTADFRIVLKIAYELYDASSGRALLRGQEEEIYTEQRSDLLRSEAQYPELDRRLVKMSHKLAERLYQSLLPASTRMGWAGRVLSVENARVYLNAGEKTGLRMGDVLKIVEPYKQISDYESGRLVGNVPGRIKGTIKIVQFFGDDGAVGVLQSGGGFIPGDIAQLY